MLQSSIYFIDFFLTICLRTKFKRKDFFKLNNYFRNTTLETKLKF